MSVRFAFVALGMLWYLGVGALVTCATEGPPAPAGPTSTGVGPVRKILLLHVVPRSTSGLVAIEQTFINTLTSKTRDRLAFVSEYVDLAMFDERAKFESELVAYLAAKHAGTKFDLVVTTGTDALQFTIRHRTRLFPGVPIVFISAQQRLVADVPLDADVSGIWVAIDWKGTLAAARRLQPDLDRVVVVTGSSPVDKVWAAEARAQFARLDDPISITYLEEMPVEEILERVGALPARTAVLLGAFLSDAAGQRFVASELTELFSATASVPVYGTSETHVGHGAVGGHVISFALQGRRGAEIAARVLRGERPRPIEGKTLAYRFDARQLRRFNLDARRLPPGSTVEFDQPSLWRTYGWYIATAVILLALQTWMIIVLLANRAQRRHAQETLAAELRFETLISDLLATHLTLPASAVDSHLQEALARIGAELDVDRMVLAERNIDGVTAEINHAWTRGDVPELPHLVEWAAFPWMAERLASGDAVVVSPLRPLPPEAETDRHGMLAYGTQSVLAVPLIVAGTVVGALSCAAVRRTREWSDALIDRLRLVADVFATTLARRRAEAAARASEERFQQQREELAHALRVNTLGELGTSLAHEINQPLSAILINVRTVTTLLGRSAPDDDTVAEALADIAADAKRAGDIITRLRALSRKQHVVERGLDVDALVDEVAGLLQQDFVRREIVVHRIAAPGLATVAGDRIQLQQIFLNVLVNAGEALETTDRGARNITITTSSPAPGFVEVSIRDSGVDGKKVDTERMFERFVTTKPGGLGMGLAISRSIAAAHRGRIYATTNSDCGITVCVELPAEA